MKIIYSSINTASQSRHKCHYEHSLSLTLQFSMFLFFIAVVILTRCFQLLQKMWVVFECAKVFWVVICWFKLKALGDILVIFLVFLTSDVFSSLAVLFLRKHWKWMLKSNAFTSVYGNQISRNPSALCMNYKQTAYPLYRDHFALRVVFYL